MTQRSFILLLATALLVADVNGQTTKRCRWWQLGCVEPSIEGLPADAPRSGTVITIDVAKNVLYLFRDGTLVSKPAVATGSEKTLINGDDEWLFRTPRGHMKVLRKIQDPVWRKPDWAYIEAGEAIPPPDSPKRLVKGKLGRFALDLGDGILIHGTDDLGSIGRKVSHGCMRLPDRMLETVYNATAVGTDVFIFDSKQEH